MKYMKKHSYLFLAVSLLCVGGVYGMSEEADLEGARRNLRPVDKTLTTGYLAGYFGHLKDNDINKDVGVIFTDPFAAQQEKTHYSQWFRVDSTDEKPSVIWDNKAMREFYSTSGKPPVVTMWQRQKNHPMDAFVVGAASVTGYTLLKNYFNS